MIPNSLDNWDYDLIKRLVGDGFFETDKFDFKEKLLHRKDDGKSITRLRRTVCAFANTEGGFLIYGVKDDRSLSYDKRIIGIDSKKGFPLEFGDKIGRVVEPQVYYDFKNPPIKIPNSSRVLHVIKIPQSPERPHMNREKGKQEFYYRKNGGNEPMSFQQIKESFLNEEQRRQKLRLLFIELLTNKEDAALMMIPGEEIEESYSLVTLDSSVLQSLLVDTYPLIISEKELVALLFTIRGRIKVINNKIKIFYSQVSLPLTKKNLIIRKHNESITQHAKELISLLDKSSKILQEKFGLSNPFEKNPCQLRFLA